LRRSLVSGPTLALFVALPALTTLTGGAAHVDLARGGGIALALTIAGIKTSLVALFFMHLKGKILGKSTGSFRSCSSAPSVSRPPLPGPWISGPSIPSPSLSAGCVLPRGHPEDFAMDNGADQEVSSLGGNRRATGEKEAKACTGDLSDFRIPALLLSGGELMIQPDLFALAPMLGSGSFALSSLPAGP